MQRISLWLAPFYWLLCVLPLLFSSNAHSTDNNYAVDAVSLNALQSGIELNRNLAYIEDTTRTMTFKEAIAAPWPLPENQSMSFSYTDSVYWFRIRITNDSNKHQNRLLVIDYPLLDYISVYSSLNDDDWALKEYGDKYPFSQRELNHRKFIIPLAFEQQDTLELVFRVQTAGSMEFPVFLWQPDEFFINDQAQILALGAYYGLMIVMFLYNFFIFLSVREKSYLYYVFYVASIAGFLASFQGLSFQLLWPEATTWNDQSIVVLLSGTVLFTALFAKHFLKLQQVKIFNYMMTTISILAVLIVVASFFLPYQNMIQVVVTLAVVHHLILMVIGITRWMQGFASARYYVFAWSTLLVGGVLMGMSKYNLIPSGVLMSHIVQLGSALEVVLLSFALADRLNQEKRRRYKAQDVALEQERIARISQEQALEQERQARVAQDKALQHEREAREAQSKALEIQKQATETLEQRVQERTEELESANRRLELMSITDPLTGLRNRRYFDQSIQREMARAIRQKESICIIMIDIDFFKKINDTYGHQVGDEVLKSVAAKINETVHRDVDLLARYGGEEFILVLPNTPIEGAKVVGENIRRNIELLDLKHLHQNLQATVSVGLFGKQPQQIKDYELWTKYADDALYQAKETGRNRVVLYKEQT